MQFLLGVTVTPGGRSPTVPSEPPLSTQRSGGRRGSPNDASMEPLSRASFGQRGGGGHCLGVWDTWGKSILGLHKTYGMFRGGNEGGVQGVLRGEK